MGYKDYLIRYKSNPDIFKDRNVKEDIINNSQKYELTWFCGDKDATSQMIYDLLDDEGMEILFKSKDRLSKVNGIIACGKNIFRLFDNELFLKMLFLLDDYYYYINEVDSLKFIKYLVSVHPDSVVKVFNKLNDKSQLYVIDNIDFSLYYNEILDSSKNSSCKYILDRISSLNGINYDKLLSIFGRDIHISEHLLDSKFIKKISTIYNVRNYRRLISELSHNNDVSMIEVKRREFYDYFLANCSEIYKLIKQDICNGVDPYLSIENHLNCFGGIDSILRTIYTTTDSIDVLFKKGLNYITTDIVVDYLFQDLSYNVFIDIRELIDFSSKTHILDEKSLLFYSKVVSLDRMSIDEKISFLNEYKSIDIVSKFYDDYLCARNKMLELINESILNSSNILKFENKDLSNKYEVPIYELNGEEFYVFVRNVGKLRPDKLNYYDLNVLYDGVSYSIDGSDKLNMYCDPHSYFAVAYDSVPENQLIHVFETDSFSNYRRDSNNVPLDGTGTDRINRLFVPYDLVNKSSSYNELLVSQPNGNNNEFNEVLSLPKPFAIYCYDEVTDSDILNAKANNLGIILVRTKKYSIDNSGRTGLFSKEDREIKYFEWSSNDDTWNIKL